MSGNVSYSFIKILTQLIYSSTQCPIAFYVILSRKVEVTVRFLSNYRKIKNSPIQCFTLKYYKNYAYIFYYQMIVRNIVTEQSEIKKFLKILCLDNPIKCEKQNISGFGTNDRVIVVRGEIFQYYDVPKKFKNGQMNGLNQENCKGSVSLTDIYQLAFLPQEKSQKKTIMLSFPINKLKAKNIQLYRTTASKASKSKQNTQNFIINWVFDFNYDVKAQLFKKLQQQQRKKKEQERKIVKKNPSQLINDSFLNISQIKNKDSQTDPVKELDYNIEKIKQVKQFIQFKDKLEKQQEERQALIKRSMSIRKTEKGNQDMDQQQQQIFPIRGVWKQFWKIYEKASRFIGLPINKEYIQKELELLNQLHKIQIQVRALAVEYVNFRMVGWGPDRITFQDFQFYKGIWIKVGGKQLNQQFLSNYYLSDLMYVTKSVKKMKFRIPPMFLINYKCCKLITMIDLPFSSIKALKKQIYNVKLHRSQLDIELVNKIKTGLQFYQRILNIKCEPYITGNLQTQAPLGSTVKIFQYDNKFQESSSTFLQNFYYVTGVKGLFPIDYEFQLQKYQPQYCLRPQIIAEYRDYMQSIYRQDNQLLTQAFKHSEIHLDIKAKQDAKVANVSKQFISIKIKKLMQEFNQISLIMVDSYSIKRYMSEMGINVRYLGHMYKDTEIPYIQETLQIEMLGRIIKNIYYDSVKEIVTDQNFFKRELYLKKHKDILVENMNEHHFLMIDNAIDFLNLVFGVGKENTAFWKIVIQKCHKKYGIKVAYPLKLKAGCLLHAVLWHCGLVVNFQLDVKLFQAEKPFQVKNFVQFRYQSKSFDFPSLQINKIIRKLSFVEEIKKDEQIERYIFNFLKLQLLKNHTSYGLGFKTQITLSKINNKGAQFQKPIRDCNYHPSELPYYFSNKSPQNFKKAVDIINFSLASNHPLFISLYDVYSQQFQPQLLKKSTLLAAIKGLGQFHPRTTELYSKFYRQGMKEFQIKAKRSEQTEAALIISQQLLSKKKYESCLDFCFTRIEKRQRQKSSAKASDLDMYIQILKHGLISATQTRFYQKGLIIAQQFSEMINSFKIRNLEDNEMLLHYSLIIRLNLTSQKFYLYKMVLLAARIQKQFQPEAMTDKQGLLLPRGKEERVKILLGIMNEYYSEETHSKWIQHIFSVLRRGYQYFNYLDDLFNNYQYHIKRYGMQDFQNNLGYLDVLIRFFGQKIFHDYLYNVTN